MNTKIQALINEAEQAIAKFALVKDSSASHYWEGRLTALEQAKACRLTDAEQAVIDAALGMRGPRSPRLAMALECLRAERCLVPTTRLPECDDCGGMHLTDSVYCPVRQQDDCDD